MKYIKYWSKLHLEHGKSLKTRMIQIYGEESTRHIIHSPAYENGI